MRCAAEPVSSLVARPRRTPRLSTARPRTSEAGGERGYDGGKRIAGRKRHLVVDSQGRVLHAQVHPADIHDRRGGEAVLAGLQARYPDITRLFADMGSQGLQRWLAAELGWQLLIVKRPPRRFWLLPGQ